jgi:hypothetical protein
MSIASAGSIRKAAGVLAGLLLTALAGGASASENKTYMGSFCVPLGKYEGSQVAVTGSTFDNEAKALSDVTLVCPIIKSVLNDSKLENVTVNWNLGSGTGNRTCDLWAMKPLVTAYNVSNHVAQAQGTVTGTGAKTMTFNDFAVGLGAAWASNFIYYEMHCKLKAGDRIVNYQVREAGTRDNYGRIYPSSMCRFTRDGSESRYSYVPPVKPNGNIAGASGGWVQAIPEGLAPGGTFEMFCPVIGDHTLGNAGTNVATIWVGKPSNYSISCTLYEGDNFTSLPYDSQTRSVNGSSTTLPTQEFNLDLPKTGGVTWARYHIRCQAQGAGDAKILGYRVQEN